MIAHLRAALTSLICLSWLAALSPAVAADYPTKPVRWLIGFAAGGPVDIVARSAETNDAGRVRQAYHH